MKYLLIILTAITITSGGLKISASVAGWYEAKVVDKVLIIKTNMKVLVNPNE